MIMIKGGALPLFLLGSPKILIFGESGGTSRPYQLAEWFGLCDLVAEREKSLLFLRFWPISGK